MRFDVCLSSHSNHEGMNSLAYHGLQEYMVMDEQLFSLLNLLPNGTEKMKLLFDGCNGRESLLNHFSEVFFTSIGFQRTHDLIGSHISEGVRVGAKFLYGNFNDKQIEMGFEGSDASKWIAEIEQERTDRPTSGFVHLHGFSKAGAKEVAQKIFSYFK